MVDKSSLSQGPETRGLSLDDCEALANYPGDEACRQVLLGVCERTRAGEETTVWDIHRIYGLGLPEAFAALRTLEFEKLIDILDNPSDAFGATIRLNFAGLDRFRKRSAA